MKKSGFLFLAVLLSLCLSAQKSNNLDQSLDEFILRHVSNLKEAAAQDTILSSDIPDFLDICVTSDRSANKPNFIIYGHGCDMRIMYGQNHIDKSGLIDRQDEFCVIISASRYSLRTSRIYWLDAQGNGYFLSGNDNGPILLWGHNYSLMSAAEVKETKETIMGVINIACADMKK